MMKRKQGLRLLLASCIPGCGEMYQGYMKRGMSVLLAFSLIFLLAVGLEMGALTVLMLPLWLFSFFDSYNLRARFDAGVEMPDGWLFGLENVDAARLDQLVKKRHSLLGWALVVLGVWALYSTVVGIVLSWIPSLLDMWWLRSLLRYDVPRFVATVGIIALGVWFIRGPKKSEEIPAFTPPEETDGAENREEDGHGEA